MSRVTSLQFFQTLRWLDNTPLLDHVEQYRRDLFTQALDTFDARDRSLLQHGAGRSRQEERQERSI